MDFTGRSSQPSQPAGPAQQFSANTGAANSGANRNNKNKNNKKANFVRWGGGVLGLLILALVVVVIFIVGVGGTKPENKYVDNSRLQAVFLQTGQVYFGKIKTLNNKYFVLDDIYYLQTSGTNANSSAAQSNTNVSLVKLGCELHAPYDQMVINRDQVTFWENLQTDGQVAKAVATFQKDNPNGQKCADQSAAPNTNSNVQSTGTTSNGGGTTNTGTSSTGTTNR